MRRYIVKCLFVCVCVSEQTYVCMRLYVCVCVCVSANVRACAHMSVCVHMRFGVIKVLYPTCSTLKAVTSICLSCAVGLRLSLVPEL